MFELYDDILTVEDVMSALKLGKNSVYVLLNSGQLRGYKEGRVWFISKKELVSYVMRRSRGE